jgi:propanol-preferring alcohol dehydrogenase
MTWTDARDFLDLAADIGLQPKVTAYPLEQPNEALAAVKSDRVDGAVGIIP